MFNFSGNFVKSGNLVRFRAPHWLGRRYVSQMELEEDKREWLVGLLVEYHKWEKIATILYDDELLRIAARDVQKYGRRYLETPSAG